MNALIIYDSQYGNTERIAQAITMALGGRGQARLARVDATRPTDLQGVDLLVVGCPTQGWGPTPAMQSMLEMLASSPLPALVVACFDTRFRIPTWISGSAAQVMAKKLRALGLPLLVPPQSFFVRGKPGPLSDGELDRASAWGRTLLETMEMSGSVV